MILFGDERLPPRFWEKAQVAENGCWLWTGYLTPHKGYGMARWKGKVRSVHRVSYEVLVGPIPEGLHVDHTCHNSDATCPGGVECLHRRCFNPNHLEPVTYLENHLCGYRNQNTSKTHCKYGHPLSGENLYVWTAPDGSSAQRKCKVCQQRRNLAFNPIRNARDRERRRLARLAREEATLIEAVAFRLLEGWE